jgi:predicted ribosome quality control (RQC) complex YloA/Tae2 family protein
MSNVDVAALAGELAASLVGARLEKAYQPAKDQILLRIRQRALGRADVLCALGRFLTVTARPPENPDQPSMVAKILRQELTNARVTGVRQVAFDRVLRFDLERGDGPRSLVFELFGDGNMLLLGAGDEILLPMRGMEHGARRLKRGETYLPPPGSASPFTLDREAFVVAGRAGKRDVVRFLAVDMGFGPLWAEELCLRAEVDKRTSVADASDAQWDALHGAIATLGRDIARHDLAPVVVFDGEAMKDAVPFEMSKYPSPRYAREEAPSFAAALDRLFVGATDEDDADPRAVRFADARGRMLRQIEQMRAAIAGFARDEAERQADGEALFLHFQPVQQTIETLRRAHDMHSWTQIEKRLAAGRAAGDEHAQTVTEVGRDATARLRLADAEANARVVTVDLRKSVQENAQAHYEAAKRARARREGAAKALAEAEARLAAIDAKGLEGFGAAPRRAVGPQRHFWFEHYRWTVLPGGFLAVGGRNAGQNDSVVKKYLRDGDRYLHAAIHGAPSVVVRPADGGSATPDEDTLRLAGQFAVCASRAWRQFGQADAYWVTPQQVSKTPRSGEFVPRGAWIIHGRRNALEHLPMEWAVGLVNFAPGGAPVALADATEDAARLQKLAGGPPDALAVYCDRVVRLVPGDVGPNRAAQRLAELFGVEIEAAQAALPGGPVRFVHDAAARLSSLSLSGATATAGGTDA